MVTRCSPGIGNSNPLQYSCLENPMDREAWWAIVHKVAKSPTQLKRVSTHPCTQHAAVVLAQLYPTLCHPMGWSLLGSSVHGLFQASTLEWVSSSWRSFQCSAAQATQPCPTLCNPMIYTVHGILQARILEWVAFPFSRASSQPRDWTQVSCIAGRFFTSWATREAWGSFQPRIKLGSPMSPALAGGFFTTVLPGPGWGSCRENTTAASIQHQWSSRLNDGSFASQVL